MRQHITVAYGHYSNGSIEVINKIFLQLMRALLSELRWDKEFWPWLNANVEHTINHRPQERAGADHYHDRTAGRKPAWEDLPVPAPGVRDSQDGQVSYSDRDSGATARTIGDA